MNGWIQLWKALCFLGLASFALMVATVTVQGGRDILAMFRQLRRDADEGPK